MDTSDINCSNLNKSNTYLHDKNMRAFIGKTEELGRVFRKICIDFGILQETRWFGTAFAVKMAIIFSILLPTYSVRIGISEGFRDVMKLTIISADRTIHFFTVYGPQIGQSDAERNAFWQLLDARTCNVFADDYIIIAGDLGGTGAWSLQ